MARVSQMFDVVNKVTIDVIINSCRVGKRELLPNDLLLLDRGYPAYWIFNLILSQGGNFCARISKQWKIVQDFIDSGTQETFIEVDYLFRPPLKIAFWLDVGVMLKF